MAEEQQLEAGVELPGGVKINTKGYHLGNFLQVVIVAAICVGVYVLIDMRADAKQAVVTAAENLKTTATAMKQEHDKLSHAIDRGTEQQEIMNYILTLSPEKREKLNLEMPQALRRRTFDR